MEAHFRFGMVLASSNLLSDARGALKVVHGGDREWIVAASHALLEAVLRRPTVDDILSPAP